MYTVCAYDSIHLNFKISVIIQLLYKESCQLKNGHVFNLKLIRKGKRNLLVKSVFPMDHLYYETIFDRSI